MKYQLLFAYQSWMPPDAVDLQKLIKLTLKPLLGNVHTRELKHYGINPAQWVCPVEISSNASATVDEIEKAIRTVEGAAEVRLIEVKPGEPNRPDQSESASRRGRGRQPQPSRLRTGGVWRLHSSGSS